MRKLIAVAALVAGAALLGGCGEEQAPGTPTAEENRELDNAADMLDTSPDSLVAGEDAPLGNGEESAETGDVLVSDGADVNAQ